MRAPAENHFRDRQPSSFQRVDEVLAIQDARRLHPRRLRRNLLLDPAVEAADEDRDEPFVHIVVFGHQLRARGRRVGDLPGGRRHRPHGARVRRQVLVDVVAQRGHRFVQAGRTFVLLFRREQLAVYGAEQQHRQHRHEHERVECVRAQMAPLDFRRHAELPARRREDRDEFGDHDRHHAVEQLLQCQRPHRRAQVAEAVCAGQQPEADRRRHPQQRARHERGLAAPGEYAYDQGFERKNHRQDDDGAERRGGDQRGEQTVPRSVQDRDRQRDDATGPQPGDGRQRHEIQGDAGGAGEHSDRRAPRVRAGHRRLRGAASVPGRTSAARRCCGRRPIRIRAVVRDGVSFSHTGAHRRALCPPICGRCAPPAAPAAWQRLCEMCETEGPCVPW